MTHDFSKLLPGATIDLTPFKGGSIKVQASRHTNPEAIRRAVVALLKGFGLDLQDDNIRDTPKRVTKMWVEWLKPLEVDFKVFPSAAEGAVTLTGHHTISVCPHHLLPFEMIVDVAYIPQGWVVGLSKLARLADLVCSSFTLQEHIPEVIVQVLSTLMLPKGVICRTRAKHGCMRLRGVRTVGEVTTTSLKGVYFNDEKARNEFLLEAIR